MNKPKILNKPKIFKSGSYWLVLYNDGFCRKEISWKNAIYYAVSGWWL